MAYATPGTVAAGDVATAAAWNVVVGDIVDHETRLLQIRRLAFQTRTTPLNINTALATTGNLFATSATFTAAGSTAYRIEVFVPMVSAPTAVTSQTIVHLTDGSNNSLGQIQLVGVGNATSALYAPVSGVYYYTPAAGSVTLNVSAVANVTTGTPQFVIGAGGASTYLPAHIAVFGPALT